MARQKTSVMALPLVESFSDVTIMLGYVWGKCTAQRCIGPAPASPCQMKLGMYAADILAEQSTCQKG